jgi:predicted DNA repair protein MutK
MTVSPLGQLSGSCPKFSVVIRVIRVIRLIGRIIIAPVVLAIILGGKRAIIIHLAVISKESSSTTGTRRVGTELGEDVADMAKALCRAASFVGTGCLCWPDSTTLVFELGV